jgi:hypothetical protein
MILGLSTFKIVSDNGQGHQVKFLVHAPIWWKSFSHSFLMSDMSQEKSFQKY